MGETCIREVRSTNKFRSGSSAQLDTTFDEGQVWLRLTENNRELQYVHLTIYGLTEGLEPLTYVDETKTTAAAYIDLSDRNPTTNTNSSSADEDDDDTFPLRPSTPRQLLHVSVNPSHTLRDSSEVAVRPLDNDHDSTSSRNSPATAGHSNLALRRMLAQRPFVLDTVKPPTNVNVNDAQDRLQAVLIRYYSQEFTKWFDLCDPEQHFAQVVPQRARSSRPLLTAILTLSARHLVRLRSSRSATSSMTLWWERMTSNVSEETAVHYHNECIRDLLRLSMDEYQVHNEDLLAAAIILRTDEEMIHGTEEAGRDQQVFLQVVNAFINTQVPPTGAGFDDLLYEDRVMGEASQGDNPLQDSSQNLMQLDRIRDPGGPPTTWADDDRLALATNDITPRIGRPGGLRQACFWVAFRQEIYASFIKQRSITFPLSRCAAFRSFSPTEDSVWANRLITLCADVLEYCYGSTSDTFKLAPSTSIARWQELKRLDLKLTSKLPSSFEPIFFAEPGGEDVLPEIWYLDACHTTGIMHAELTRILLAVWDPTRPKFGPGHLASTRQLSATLRNIVLRLCGIANGNQQSPPNFINAFMGISMGGEYFEDRREQQALLDILSKLEDEYAYSTGSVAGALKDAWGWNSL